MDHSAPACSYTGTSLVLTSADGLEDQSAAFFQPEADMNTTARITTALMLAAASVAGFAQTAPTPSISASQPNAVGVTAETARVANDKAIKRSDVATVVRTGPTVADRTRKAGDKVDPAVNGATNTDGTTVANGNRTATLAPRVDRN
jgi:hypothetical protein